MAISPALYDIEQYEIKQSLTKNWRILISRIGGNAALLSNTATRLHNLKTVTRLLRVQFSIIPVLTWKYWNVETVPFFSRKHPDLKQ